jgi:predicted  nucleic acid-binding Zn-ribbon protein
MGPSNVALLKLFRADQALREARAKLDSVTRDVKAQEIKLNQLSSRHASAVAKHKDLQAKSANFELDLKMREEHLEKLRGRQAQAVNNKEYQALLVEINTAKVDRAKVEEQAIRLMEQMETAGLEVKNLTAQLDAENAKLAEMNAKVGDKAAAARAEVDSLTPARQEAASVIKPSVLVEFDRLGDRYDGEALAAIDKPNLREEEYLCTGCNVGLVPDVYNKLKTRDDIVTCNHCRRMLYIPDNAHFEVQEVKKSRASSGATKAKSAGKTVKRVLKAPEPELPGSKWKDIVSRSQGESVEGAKDADQRPVECKVEVNGELVGTFKGKSPDHLERVIRFNLDEAKMSADVKVTAVPVLESAPDASTQAPSEPPAEA